MRLKRLQEALRGHIVKQASLLWKPSEDGESEQPQQTVERARLRLSPELRELPAYQLLKVSMSNMRSAGQGAICLQQHMTRLYLLPMLAQRGLESPVDVRARLDANAAGGILLQKPYLSAAASSPKDSAPPPAPKPCPRVKRPGLATHTGAAAHGDMSQMSVRDAFRIQQSQANRALPPPIVRTISAPSTGIVLAQLQLPPHLPLDFPANYKPRPVKNRTPTESMSIRDYLQLRKLA